MNKKVRYAAGAAAAAIPTLGLMMPGAAAAAPVHKQASGGKTVTLRHLRATPDAGCTGKNKVVTTNNHNSTLRFWWTAEPQASGACIGTVKGYTRAPLLNAESYWRIRIYEHNRAGKKVMGFSHHVNGPEPGLMMPSHSFSYGVHRSFGFEPIQVCMAAVTQFGTTSPTCHSVT